jgi:solute carrier family 10 (sodium/bile acid cotransporter), member 3/5
MYVYVLCSFYFAPSKLAYTFINLFQLPPVESLALFLYGCSPGGAASNNWTIVFGGDIDLSALLTFFATLGSLVVLPAWLYTLGTTFTQNAKIEIPFLRLIMNLFITIGPCRKNSFYFFIL